MRPAWNRRPHSRTPGSLTGEIVRQTRWIVAVLLTKRCRRLRIMTRSPRYNNWRYQNFPSAGNKGMSRFTNSITAFRITQPADTPIWPAIIFTRDNTALGRLTLRRVIAFVGADFRALLRFSLTSPFFTSMVQESSVIYLLFLSHKNVQSHSGSGGKAGPAKRSCFGALEHQVSRRCPSRWSPAWVSPLIYDGAGSRIRTDDLLITNQPL
jgi:hypothetical protein